MSATGRPGHDRVVARRASGRIRPAGRRPAL